MSDIILNGSNLTVQDLTDITLEPRRRVKLDPKSMVTVHKSQKFLQNNLKGKIIYGINTGFGPMASHILAPDQLLALQENLVRSHATGMGQPIDPKFVLAAMVVRLNTLLRGYSGVSEGLLRQLEFFINHRIIPIVYEHGAVGTSGDLVQLAHIVLALIGEGQVYFQGHKQATSVVLKKLKRSAYKLGPKEGLAMINGTSMMTAIGSLIIHDAHNLLNLAVLNGALALELVQAFDDSFSDKLQKLRPHPGQIAVAAVLRQLLAKSKLLKSRSDFKYNLKNFDKVNKIPEEVQEVYSLRCIPQILGPVHDTLSNADRVITIELNSVTDNPIVDFQNKAFLHGGNFHGDYVAQGLDQLKISLVKLSMLSERRINYFLNHKVNLRFPPFLNLKTPGLNLGLQGLQFVATSTAAQNQSLAYPHYIHSISTNGDNQDIVSMGTDAALMARQVIENSYIILGIELITLAQAVDYLAARGKLSTATRKLYDEARKIFPVIRDDREMIDQLSQIVSKIKISRNISLNW